MRKVNPNIYPKTGYVFKEADGTKLRGDSWKGVIARVKLYRQRNGMPEGNPEVEVMDQACRDNPGICHEEDPRTQEQLKRTSIKGRILAWLARVRRIETPLIYVPAATAKARADICAGCPKNTPITEGCSSCRAAVKEMRTAVLGGRKIDGRITGCCVTGEDLPVSTNLEQQALANAELPDHCWRKRTL